MLRMACERRASYYDVSLSSFSSVVGKILILVNLRGCPGWLTNLHLRGGKTTGNLSKMNMLRRCQLTVLLLICKAQILKFRLTQLFISPFVYLINMDGLIVSDSSIC